MAQARTAKEKATRTDAEAPGPAREASAFIARNARNYDALPYASHPFALSQPARIGAIAKLFGLSPPNVGTARVLEIGCASGGNILPLAARFPGAHFTGVDLSPVQIAAARARAARHNLANIEFSAVSITDFTAEAGAFDYIICHGVFSWVDASVREAILASIGKWLAPNGVADVSYNVLPGWRMRMALRDAMVLHAGELEDQAHRVTRARWFLNFLAQHTNSSTIWGQIYRHEAAHIAQMPDDYIAHEFLEPSNDPMTFTAFTDRATAHGLAYLGDADVAMMIPENLDPATAVMLREMCGGKALPVEQYMDVVSGRTFRQSLIVRNEATGAISRQLDPRRLERLYFSASGALRRVETNPAGAVFADAAGRTLRSSDPSVAAAIDTLIARTPATSTIDDLAARAPESRAAILDAIMRMLQVGLVGVALTPANCAPRLDEKPVADPFARKDAESAATTANRRHESVSLGPVARVLLPELDGTRDRLALQGLIVDAVNAGTISFHREGMAITTADGVAREAAAHVDATLAELARTGLLI